MQLYPPAWLWHIPLQSLGIKHSSISAKEIYNGYQLKFIITNFVDLATNCRFLRPCLVPKNFFPKTSHRIFGHMHGVLNIDKFKN